MKSILLALLTATALSVAASRCEAQTPTTRSGRPVDPKAVENLNRINDERARRGQPPIVFARARELVSLPVERRPGRMAASLEGAIIDANGKPAVLSPANYYVFYFAASTCPRCKVFTPKFVDYFNKSLAGRKDVAFVSWPTDTTTPPYLEYARQNSIPWPSLPVERKTLFANLGVFEIPGILVVDRFGNRLLASNQNSGAPLEAAEKTLTQLDGVLKALTR